MTDNSKTRDKQITREIHRLFWRANWQDPVNLIICYLARIPGAAISNSLVPLAVAYGIEAIVSQNFDSVGHYAWIVVGLSLLWVVLWSIGATAINRNGIPATKYVQSQVFQNFLGKDYEFYSNTFVGSLSAQAIKLRDAFDGYSNVMTLGAPRLAVMIVTGLGVIAWQSYTLAAITLVCMIAVLSFTILTSRWRLRFRRDLSEETSELAGVIGDALGQGVTVKSFATEDYEAARLNKALIPWSKAQYRQWMSAIPSDDGRQILAGVTIAILLVASGRMYQDGSIPVAVVALVQLYVIRMVMATQEIADLIKTYEAAMGGAYQAVKTMLIESKILDKVQTQTITDKDNLTIQFEKVTFRYDGSQNGKLAVDGLDLTIAPGEKIGVVGYSGSGKTTLTKLLLRFMDVTGGSIKINDVNIRDLRQQDLRRLISYVPQEPLLFHRTILENIAYGRPDSPKAEVVAAAKAAYVDEFVNELPDGYETLVGERGVKLSGGQRQRVAIARAILRDAPILVLDEATSALDSRSEQLIQKALWKLMKGRTALVIAHRLSTIQRMNRIAVMDKGKIVQLGTHEELLKDKKGIYAQLWAHQSGGYVGVPDKNQIPDDTVA